MLATSLVQNAGFNCLTTRVIVQHSSWAQREALLDALRGQLAAIPVRNAYYPGAHDRHREFVTAHPGAEHFGQPGEGELPWTLIAGVDPEQADDISFTTEAFCGLFSETPLDAPDVPSYIDRAVEFANTKLWGTLSATIIVHPRSMQQPEIAAAVDRAVANLRYGTVAVNHWAGLAYGLASGTWGGFPGEDIGNIQSGIGSVFNPFMFARPQKTVLRAPFRIKPLPVWFASRAGKDPELGRRLVSFEAAPGLRSLLPLLWSGLAR
jgi:hypothetical protein